MLAQNTIKLTGSARGILSSKYNLIRFNLLQKRLMNKYGKSKKISNGEFQVKMQKTTNCLVGSTFSTPTHVCRFFCTNWSQKPTKNNYLAEKQALFPQFQVYLFEAKDGVYPKPYPLQKVTKRHHDGPIIINKGAKNGT
jgi:hypothetical protein